MDQETLFTGSVYYSARNCQKVINNDSELLVNKFAGKHGRNIHFFWSEAHVHTHIRSHI